jgi:hypothetical protein
MEQHIVHYVPGIYSARAKPEVGGLLQVEGLVDTKDRFALRTRAGEVEVTHMPSGMLLFRRTNLYDAVTSIQRCLDEMKLFNWADPNPTFTETEQRIFTNIVRGEPNA